MSSEMPEELREQFPSGLASSAGELHEVYKEQVRAGFTPIQSIYLVGCIITGSPGPAPADGVTPPE